MKPLKFYIESGLVRQGSKNPGESKAMITRASKRLEYVKSQSITEDNASFLFEDIYEIMRECIHFSWCPLISLWFSNQKIIKSL